MRWTVHVAFPPGHPCTVSFKARLFLFAEVLYDMRVIADWNWCGFVVSILVL